MASSLPGMIKSIGSGSELVSAIAIIGIPSFLASNTANLSLTVSNITSKSGFPDKFLIPPILESNLSFSLDSLIILFLKDCLQFFHLLNIF